jgi:acyl carrier protein
VDPAQIKAAPPAEESPRERPQSELERRIAAVWTEVLGVEGIGLHDNFFDLGGHSLLVAQAHHRLQENLGLAIPLLAHFQYTTVHSFAEYLGRGGADELSFEEGQARAESRRTAMDRQRRIRRSGRVQVP